MSTFTSTFRRRPPESSPDDGRPVRVLVVTDYYPPFIGGAQIQTQRLARGLARRGYDVVVVTVGQPGLPRLENDNGIPVHRLRHLHPITRRTRSAQTHHAPFPDPLVALALTRLIRRFRPDVVQSYGWITYSCAAALLGRSTPLLVTARDYGYGCANRTLLRDGRQCNGPVFSKCLACAARNYGYPKGWFAALGVFVSRTLLRRKATALHAVSSYVDQTLQRDVAHGRIPSYVIHDSVADPRLGQDDPIVDEGLRPWTDRLPERPYILFVGALREVKGVTHLLDAYRRLHDPPPLVLIGTVERDGPAELPEGIVFIEDAPHALMPVAWDRSLFGVLPSLFPEPFGTVVVEAMSRGKAVIGTAPGGHVDLLEDGATGLLVPPGDVDALVAAMRRLLADEHLRVALGDSARRRAEDFSADATLPRLERLLLMLAGGDNGSADVADRPVARNATLPLGNSEAPKSTYGGTSAPSVGPASIAGEPRRVDSKVEK